MSDKYRQAFQEEARELLGELESALLELDQKNDDREALGRAFRALHTIKGSGSMFGFDDTAAFAHELETVFDRLRAGELAVSSQLINLALAAGDQIRVMLDAAGTAADNPEGSRRILAELRALVGSPKTNPGPADWLQPRERTGAGRQRRYRVGFKPAADMLANGTNPLLLLRELQDLGTASIEVDASQLPALADMTPDRCYLAWSVALTTSATVDDIRDIFIFVEDSCELSVQEDPEASPEQRQDASGIRKNGAVPKPASSIRVSAEKLDQLVNLVGELVTVQARLSDVAARRNDAEILDISEAVDRLTASLRENSMSIRMLPLRSTFERFRRLVHDLGRDLQKDAELVTEGADTELDKTVIDQLNDPLVHLIRNAMDHGIELPEIRQAAGKRRTAAIHLSAQHSGAHVLIRIRDDGRGLDAAAVRTRAVEQGLMHAEAQLSEQELFSLILCPGFSTSRQVTDLSGRGVGMDVVRRSVEALRGSVEIASQPGAGMSVTLRLPLTLAIIDGLLVRVGKAYFVIPLANSLECVELTKEDIQDAHGNQIANIRGELTPYIRLAEYFEIHRADPDLEQIMLVETEHGHFGLVVDEVLGDHQTVIKNLGRLYRNHQVVSGATILGDGSVALILDPHRLVQGVIQATAQSKRTSGTSWLRTEAA